jgi:hypothetical protein
MKKTLSPVSMIMVFAPQLTGALELGLQPRFSVGLLNYEYSQKAYARTTPGKLFVGPAAFSATISELTIKDTLPLVRGGLTWFAHRFFVDLDAQYAFNGSDNANLRDAAFIAQEENPAFGSDVLVQTDSAFDAEFDRTEFAVAVGYQTTKQLVLYAGYKEADTKFEQNGRGEILIARAPSGPVLPFLSGPFTGKGRLEVHYDGPFVGANYTWGVKAGSVDGLLAGNIGLAFLNGNVSQSGIVSLRTLDGRVQSVDLDTLNQGTNIGDLNGDTVGLSLGLTWRGFTPVQGLTYSVGLTGYRYDFNSDQAPDFSESALRFDVGLTYTRYF